MVPPVSSRSSPPVGVRFQVGELRKHQLLETRVRCYALRHERITLPEDAKSGTGMNGSSGGDLELGGSGVGGALRGGGGCVGTSPADLAAKQPDQVERRKGWRRSLVPHCVCVLGGVGWGGGGYHEQSKTKETVDRTNERSNECVASRKGNKR